MPDFTQGPASLSLFFLHNLPANEAARKTYLNAISAIDLGQARILLSDMFDEVLRAGDLILNSKFYEFEEFVVGRLSAEEARRLKARTNSVLIEAGGKTYRVNKNNCWSSTVALDPLQADDPVLEARLTLLHTAINSECSDDFAKWHYCPRHIRLESPIAEKFASRFETMKEEESPFKRARSN